MRYLDKATLAILLVMFLIIGLAVQESRGVMDKSTIQTEEVFQAKSTFKQ